MRSGYTDLRSLSPTPFGLATYAPPDPVAEGTAGATRGQRLSRPVLLSAATIALAIALIAAGRWVARQPIAVEGLAGLPTGSGSPLGTVSVVVELAAAVLIGLLVTAVQREVGRDRTLNRSMEQAQVLLCVSGALMMIIIGDSLARAFGIAGAAAIIRFRTPVDDPRDATILFLLLALGMAAGIGAMTVAGLGTLALCALLPTLEWFSGVSPRTASVECTAAGPEFPVQQVRTVFAQHGIRADARELVTGDTARMKYIVSLAPSHRLEELTEALVRGAGLAAVAWDVRKKP